MNALKLTVCFKQPEISVFYLWYKKAFLGILVLFTVALVHQVSQWAIAVNQHVQ